MGCRLFHKWNPLWTVNEQGDEPENEAKLWQTNCLRCGKIKERWME